MSGSQVHVSQLVPRGNAAGTVVVAYDASLDSFAALLPSALTGLTGPTGPTGATGAQGPQGVAGSAGTNGKTILGGIGAPAQALGTNGDWYIDTQNKMFYGPKANAAWPTGFSIVGPTGPQGPQGIQGVAGTGGGSGTGNVTNGTIDGQIPVWSSAGSTYAPQVGTAITADRSPTVELSAGTALTFTAHNRRNIVLAAAAPLTLALSEIGTSPNQGMEFTINNDHTAIVAITFGAGITVRQPTTGTGTGQVVNVAVNGLVAVQVYPKGATMIAKCRGDVA